jgi:ribose transport system substrate-binding protein
MAPKKLSRRDFLRLTAAAGAAATLGGVLEGCAPKGTATPGPQATAPAVVPTTAAKKPWLVTTTRSLSNPYDASWDVGGQMFAESLGLKDHYQALIHGGDDTKQLDDIKGIIAKAGKDVVININANTSANARPAVEICEQAGVYCMTQWGKPDDLHPWDYKYYVAHMQADDVGMAYDTAVLMFKKLNGKGKALFVEGIRGNSANTGRLAGFKKALVEYPGIEFLGSDAADWDQTKTQNLVANWLVKYPQIDVIGTAGGPAPLGAVAAIKAGRPDALGKLLISGCDGQEPETRSILAGEIYCTNGIDAKWQGGIGLSLPYHAYTGAFDPAKEPQSHREFYFSTTLVTKENAQKWLDENILGKPAYDWNDLWGGVLSQITYGS